MLEPKNDIDYKTTQLHIRSKTQAKKVVEQLFPKMNIRIVDTKGDGRKQNHEVAIMEDKGNGKLEFILGAPTLELAVNWLIANVEIKQRQEAKENK